MADCDTEAGRNDGILTCWPATKDTMDDKDRNAVKERGKLRENREERKQGSFEPDTATMHSMRRWTRRKPPTRGEEHFKPFRHRAICRNPLDAHLSLNGQAGSCLHCWVGFGGLKQRGCDPTPAQRIDSLGAHEKWPHPGSRFDEPPTADQRIGRLASRDHSTRQSDRHGIAPHTWRLVHHDKEQTFGRRRARSSIGCEILTKERKGLFLGAR